MWHSTLHIISKEQNKYIALKNHENTISFGVIFQLWHTKENKSFKKRIFSVLTWDLEGCNIYTEATFNLGCTTEQQKKKKKSKIHEIKSTACNIPIDILLRQGLCDVKMWHKSFTVFNWLFCTFQNVVIMQLQDSVEFMPLCFI